MMNIMDVSAHLKQRPPFQMIEKVTELEPGARAVGIKNVCINEPYFAGHFPGSPIMPGVLQIESAAQLCSLTLDAEPDDEYVYVILKINDFKFLRPVLPGDTLTVSVTKDSDAGGLYKFSVSLTVDGQLRSKGALTFARMRRADIYS